MFLKQYIYLIYVKKIAGSETHREKKIYCHISKLLENYAYESSQ